FGIVRELTCKRQTVSEWLKTKLDTSSTPALRRSIGKVKTVKRSERTHPRRKIYRPFCAPCAKPPFSSVESALTGGFQCWSRASMLQGPPRWFSRGGMNGLKRTQTKRIEGKPFTAAM